MFRIWIYLNLSNFIKFFFLKKNYKIIISYIKNTLGKQSKKKYVLLTSQCRIGFLYILKYLKNKNPKKNEIIFSAYNLPEMINVAKNLNYKIRFCDINYKTGFVNLNQIQKLISNKTNIIVLTNMFNTYQDSLKLKKIAKRFKINLIEDNAIYFDNFSKNRKKNYSGSVGDFSIYSFNIMKNVSSLYGGAVTTNDYNFYKFYDQESKNLLDFNFLILFRQTLIFVILKVMSINILYKFIFFKIIKKAHKQQNDFILKIIYPSLRFIKKKFPNYYFTKISKMSLFFTYLQLKNKDLRKNNFNLRKQKNIHYFKNLVNLRKNKILNLIKIKNFNYQNFLDFPILVHNKYKFNYFLLNRGIEIRFKQYYNCAKMFSNREKCKNADLYEKKLVCLPNHPKISINYANYILKNIENYIFRYNSM